MGQPRCSLPLLTLLLAASISAQAQERTYRHNYRSFLVDQKENAPEQDDAQGRIEWMRERMGGDLDASFMRNLITEAAKERQKYPDRFPGGPDAPVAALGNSWRNIGPTSSLFTQNYYTLTKVDSGRPKTILPHPTDPNTVYLLNAGGGLWKTTNFLSDLPTWVPKTDFVGSNTGGSAAFGRVPTTLYVGMGDAFDVGVGGIMLASTNGGDTWGTAFLGTAADNVTKVYDVKVDTSTASDIILVGSNSGLFRSTDNGVSYVAVASASGQPFNLKKVWSIQRTSLGWLASAESTARVGSMYFSTDQGASWNPITNAGGVYAGAGRTTLGIGAPGDAVVYAFAATTGDGAQLDLFKSVDGGLTWAALGLAGLTPTNPNSDQTDMNVMHTQAFYNHMVLVDPSDASRNTVYLGGNLSSVKSTDGGASWTVLSNWLAQFGLPYVHADFHAAAMSTTGGTPRIYFGTDGGLFSSTDGGTTWDDTKNKGLASHLIYALTSNPGNPDSALVGLQDNGTRLRVGNSDVWNQVKGGDGFGVAWSQANNNISLQSYVYSAIRRSTVNPPIDQSNFTTATTGIVEAGNGNTSYFVTPLTTPAATADPTGNVFFTNTVQRVYKTVNGAATWTPIGASTALAGGTIAASTIVRAVSHGVAVSPLDTNHVALAGASGFLWITSDGGTTWTGRDLDSANAGMLGVALWPGFNANVAYANNSLMYVCAEAPIVTGSQNRVAKSTDGGATWALAATGLPSAPVTKLAVDPGDATGNTVYAATWLGVYKTTNGGTGWSLFGNGLPQVRVTDIYVAPDSSYVRVSTWGRGVWDLQVAPAPFAHISAPNPIHQGETGVASVTPQPGASYLWTVSGGTLLSGLNEAGATFKAGTGASLTLGVTVTAGDLTTATDSQILTIAPAVAPNATITAANAAPQGATGLGASVPPQPATTYAWTIGGGGAITSATNGSSISYSAGTGTSVNLGVTVTNGGGVSAPGTKVVTITSAPVPDATITAPGSLSQGAGGFVASVPTQPFSTYAWTVTGGTITGPTNGPSLVYAAGTGTTLDVAVTVINGGGASASSTVTLPIAAAPAPDATITAEAMVVHGTTGHAASVPTQSGATYAWTITGGSITSSTTGSNIAYTAGSAASVALGVTVTSGSGAIATNTRLVSVDQSGEYMFNPGYELGSAGWGGTTGEIGPWAPAHSGNNLCYLNGYGTVITEYIYQNVDLPAGASAANLSFYLWIDSADAGVVPNDTFTLDVYNATGTTVLQHLADFSNLDRGTGYALHTYSLDPALMGQTVRILARGSENGSLQTGFILDDWSLQVTAPAATDAPISTITAAASTTQGATDLMASVPSQPGATYAWTITGGTATSATNGNSLLFTAGMGTSLNLGVTVTNGIGANSNTKLVAINPAAAPDATITAANSVTQASAGLTASVPAQTGATYMWTITGGTITAGATTNSVTYSAGTGTSLTLSVTVTNAGSVSANANKAVIIDLAPAPDATITTASSVTQSSMGQVASVPAQAGATFAWTITGGTITAGGVTNSVTYTAGSGTSLTLSATVTNVAAVVANASKVVPVTPINFDLDGDASADPVDMAVFVKALGSSTGQPNYNVRADLNHDGVIDAADITLFLALLGN